ncbi:hypothetical protein DRF59_17225 [Chryseobacterium flavum]|uniref:Right handed beta helix domain-containing protein n=1 Tax=Chryseobacterium flavum TaxID=415851 RepID=A0A3D9CHD7_9FLAO|nr:hypothetical protein [Chryseobacterium flavum]REC65193.1 hypothetical protein DRF59_17225 [Chryseobacterium flavum]
MIYTEDFFSPGNTSPADNVVSLIDSFSHENVNFKKTTVWLDGSPMTDAKIDNIIYRKKGTFYYKRVTGSSKVLHAKIFNPFCDGINDDCLAISKMMKISSMGYTIDGNALTYHLLNRITEEVDNFSFINFNFRLNNNYDLDCGWKVTVKKNIVFENIFIDGGRGTYKNENGNIEKWIQGPGDASVPSIIPNLVDVFLFIQGDKKSNASIKKLRAVNIHAISAITFYSYGNVNVEDSDFENISMKPFHVYHSFDDGETQSGKTFIKNITTKNCGYLWDTILEKVNSDQSPVVRNRANSKGMIQWGYGAIVSFGEYYIENIKVENYGASAVCSDRNTKFFGNCIYISNDSDKFESNNPSGGMWFEATGNAYISNLSIDISNRSSRDLNFDSSALQTFNTELYIDNLQIKTNVNKVLLKKGIRASYNNNNKITVNNLYIRGAFQDQSVFHGIMEFAKDQYPLESKFVLNEGIIEEGNLLFWGTGEVNLSKINALTSKIEFQSPVSIQFNKISIKESSFYYFNTITHYKQMILENSTIISNFFYNSNSSDVVIKNSNINGALSLPYTVAGSKICISGGDIGRTRINGYHVFIDHVKSYQGLYIDNAQFFTINNCILKTSESEPVIMVSNNNDRLISGMISHNILSIKNNTSAAGYILLTPEAATKVSTYNNSETNFD